MTKYKKFHLLNIIPVYQNIFTFLTANMTLNVCILIYKIIFFHVVAYFVEIARVQFFIKICILKNKYEIYFPVHVDFFSLIAFLNLSLKYFE